MMTGSGSVVVPAAAATAACWVAIGAARVVVVVAVG